MEETKTHNGPVFDMLIEVLVEAIFTEHISKEFCRLNTNLTSTCSTQVWLDNSCAGKCIWRERASFSNTGSAHSSKLICHKIPPPPRKILHKPL